MANMCRKQNQAGMGLIETLLILLFVTIGVVALVTYQHQLSADTNNARQQFDAVILANKQMETLRDFSVLNTTNGYTAYSDIGSGTSSATVGNTAFSIAWTTVTNTTPNYKTVTVTVSWTDRFGTSRSVQINSQIAGYDPASSAAIK